MGDISRKIGFAFAPYTFVVERGKIREFALAIGDDNPIYHDPAAAQRAGYRDIPVPPTFSTVMDMWAGPDFEQLTKLLELNPLQVLHGEQMYEYSGDICAGDVLTAHSRVIAAETKKAMNLLTLETVYVNGQGEQVLTAQSVIIERHTPPNEAGGSV
ncbi:MAG: MaoC family dehydratase N-terminal domain-containing protein [Brevibacillus sp.]|nr:MaoC family dehydratase N-terminal domain-containing protein [Brevibacillus sp.]